MDEKGIVLSIITPSKDLDPEIFQKTAASVLSAMQPNWEWVIVVHNSTPDAAEQIRQLTGNDSNISVCIKNDDIHSPASPRNTGLLLARGKYIYFLDHDDLLKREFLLKAIEKMERDGCDLLLGNAEKRTTTENLAEMPMDLDFPVFEDGYIVPKSPEPLGRLLVGAGAFLGSRVIRRSLITENNIQFDEDLILMEDHVFNVRCYAYANRICVMAGLVAYTYVQHENSLLQKIVREDSDPEMTYLEPIHRVVRVALDNGISPGRYLWLMLSFAAFVYRHSSMSTEKKRRLMAGIQEYLPLMKPEDMHR